MNKYTDHVLTQLARSFGLPTATVERYQVKQKGRWRDMYALRVGKLRVEVVPDNRRSPLPHQEWVVRQLVEQAKEQIRGQNG